MDKRAQPTGKQRLLVTIEVTVDASSDLGLAKAIEELKREPPRVHSTCAGYDGPRNRQGYATDFSGASDYSYSLRSVKTTSVRKAR